VVLRLKALMGLLQKAGPALSLSMSLDKPITKYSNCGIGESRESSISRLYVEMGVWNAELLSLTTSPTLVMGRNRSHPLARSRRSHRPAEYSSTLNTPAEKPGLVGLTPQQARTIPIVEHAKSQ
jgi:hypothetical protein